MAEVKTIERKGDPDADWQLLSTQIAYAHKIEHQVGWEYRSTCAVGDEPWDPTKPPPGDGWVLNTYAGTDGYSEGVTSYDKPIREAHWCRKK